MDQIFGDSDFVFVYLDDIFISSGTEDLHCKHLSKASLAINLLKSEFFASKLEFLGHVVDASAISPSLKHTAAVLDYPAQRSKEEISRFLCLLNFLWSFLPNAALLLPPLTSLMKKSVVFVWGKDQQNSFKQAKRALLNAVTLQHQSPTAQIQMSQDQQARALSMSSQETSWSRRQSTSTWSGCCRSPQASNTS